MGNSDGDRKREKGNREKIDQDTWIPVREDETMIQGSMMQVPIFESRT